MLCSEQSEIVVALLPRRPYSTRVSKKKSLLKSGNCESTFSITLVSLPFCGFRVTCTNSLNGHYYKTGAQANIYTSVLFVSIFQPWVARLGPQTHAGTQWRIFPRGSSHKQPRPPHVINRYSSEPCRKACFRKATSFSVSLKKEHDLFCRI